MEKSSPILNKSIANTTYKQNSPSLFFQPKLTVNQPNDVYEQEADTMADRVMRMPDTENTKQPFFKPVLTSIQRKCKNCEEEQKLQRKEEESTPLTPVKESGLQRKCAVCEEEKKVQRKEEGGDIGGREAPATVHNIINSGGQPLDGGTRDFMESRFGYDFSRVQIHNGPSAHRSSEDINALAYTHGNHVVFGEGQYQPNTNTGKQLLAHELTHVVQQTQSSDSGLTRKKDKEIQRSAYWSEASPYGKQRTGKDAEKVLERALQGNDAEIQSQAPIPNANRSGNYGLALTGFADLYKGKPLGIYFGYPIIATCRDGENLGKPLAIRSRTKAAVSDKGVREFMNDAPDNITMGEIKPASNDLIAFGKKQLGSYESGITFANKQFNCWAQFKGLSGKWNKPDFHRLTTAIPPEYVYHPGSPKSDLNLGVFDFIGTERGNRATIGRAKPASININIPGGLYFLDAKDGVFIYYYQPANLDAVLQQLGADSRSNLFREYLLYATELQQAVINPLTVGPEEVQTKRRSQQPPDQNCSTDSDTYIQRKDKKKTESKMKDTFNLSTWESSRTKYQEHFKTKDVAFRDKLEFLEDIKKADQSNHAATGQATAFHDFNVDVGKHNNKPVKKEASSLFGWMDIWASAPIKTLGWLRSKFGGAFVRVSQFFSNIKSRIGQTIQGAENDNAPKGISWGQLAIKAFWGALVSLGGMVLREVDHLLISSFVSGLKIRFEQYIPTDRAQFEEMVENEFPILKEIEGAIKTLEDGFLGTIEGIVGRFSDLIATYRSIADTFQQYGRLIKWANVALQCGTPPGLGCLKLIATALAQYWIDKILNWCWTKKKFAGLVGGIEVIKSIPKKIADFVAGGIESFLPNSFLPVFDRALFDTRVAYDTDEIICGDEITEAQVAMTELFDTLQQKLGPNYYDLIAALQKYGVPPDEPRSAEEIRELTKRIPDMTITDINMYLEKAASGGYKAGGTLNVADFLINVKEANDAYLAEQAAPSGNSTTSNNTTGITADGSGTAAGNSGSSENQGGESTIPYFENENIHGKKFTGPGKINLNYAIFGVKRGQVKGNKIKISITALFYENSKPIDISVTNIPAMVYDRQFFKDEHLKEKTNADHAKIMGVYVEVLEDVFFEKDKKRYATIYPGQLHRPAIVSLNK
ncbi:MAG: hypothetical protein JWP37_353 [Mucilaginibacter sp.]|nr:hypothetical protein [Mucilaginibacter sp.]